MQVLPVHALTDPREQIKQKAAAIEYRCYENNCNVRTSQYCPANTCIRMPRKQAKEASVIVDRGSTTQCKPAKQTADVLGYTEFILLPEPLWVSHCRRGWGRGGGG